MAIDEQHAATGRRAKRGPLRRVGSGSLRAAGWLLRLTMKFVLIAAFIGGGLFVGGFLQFANTVTRVEPVEDVPKSEAIIALTGGSARIERALRLIELEKAERLFISGVNPTTSREAIAAVHAEHAAAFACCVELGREARDTVGNAAEAADWVKRNGYNSIILVTSGYHMPRAMVEFDRRMEGIIVRPHSVPLEELSRDGWWRNGETLRFILGEYLKFLGAKLRGVLPADTLQTLRANTLGG